MSVLVILQSSGSEWHRASLEAAAAGQHLANGLSLPLNLAVLGNDVARLVVRATSYRVDKVYALEHPLLGQYTPEAYTSAIQQVIRARSPSYVLLPHTYQVRDYAPKLAAKFGRSLISDVIEIRLKEGKALFVRQLFLGKMHAEIASGLSPVFVSIQASAFRPLEPCPEQAGVTMETVNIQLDPTDVLSQPEPPFKTMPNSIDLKAANTIVSVGRGVKQMEDLSLVDALVKELNAELGASRPMCDSGLVPMNRLIGSSGQTVAPDLYIAVGISGAIQHLLGMKGARTVVAINNDPSAPIFNNAHYGIVGDLRSVVPALLEELRKTKS